MSPGMTGEGPDAQRMADIVSSMCIQFARTGNPNHEGQPNWLRYSLKGRATMCFNLPPRLVDDPQGRELAGGAGSLPAKGT